MIVVDTSALVAILKREPLRDACIEALDQNAACMSAGTLVECFVTAEWNGVGDEMRRMIGALAPQIIPVTDETAYEAHLAYKRWGEGRHPAGLNFGDCFSYVAATQRSLPLLFVGNDFSQTDIVSAL
ncbi:MAG: type II toxin-antitoxin system VapC family toxin [Devosia sp.]|nr:type II toxin-antitoxin system VapC family toxin [Devosia sp.]